MCGTSGWISAATMNASTIGRSGSATLMKSHSRWRSPPRIGSGIGAVSSVRLNTTGAVSSDLPFAAVDGNDMVAWVGEVDVYRAVVLGNPQVQTTRLCLRGKSFQRGEGIGEGLLRGHGVVSLEVVSGQIGAQSGLAAAQRQRDVGHLGLCRVWCAVVADPRS